MIFCEKFSFVVSFVTVFVIIFIALGIPLHSIINNYCLKHFTPNGPNRVPQNQKDLQEFVLIPVVFFILVIPSAIVFFICWRILFFICTPIHGLYLLLFPKNKVDVSAIKTKNSEDVDYGELFMASIVISVIILIIYTVILTC